jgi:hypothetical protein
MIQKEGVQVVRFLQKVSSCSRSGNGINKGSCTGSGKLQRKLEWSQVGMLQMW